MRHRKFFGFLFLAISAVFCIMSLNPTISAGVIGINTNVSLTFILGLIFFIFSIVVFTSRQTLDAILIPTGTPEADVLRTETALKGRKRLKDRGYFVISGHYTHGDINAIRKSQDYGIYKHLREEGVIPGEMIVEGQAHDTLENTLYSLKKIRQRAGNEGTLDIGISTYHGHFQRFKDFYEKAVKKGMIKKGDFRLHEIPTEETGDDRNYESNLLRRLAHQFKLATIGRYKSKKEGIKQAERTPLILMFMNKLRGK